MEERATLPKVAMHITRGCLVVPIQVELYCETIIQIQKDVLERVKETGAKGVIIDVSGVDIIDSFIAQTISDTARMASMLGATTVLTGFKPDVVASLIDLDFELKDIQTAITLEDGFQRLKPIVEPKEKSEEIEEPEEESGEDQECQAGENEEIEAEDNEREKTKRKTN